MSRAETPLWPLTDSIAVNRGVIHNAVSPGDLLILGGVLCGAVEFALLSRPSHPARLRKAT
jgi:hypothetical protein